MVAAAVLKESMKDDQLLDKRVFYTQQELDASGYHPVTQQHLSDGMTIRELCAAALTASDNGAMNLLLKQFNGVDFVNAFARSIGDNTFRLDRDEPDFKLGHS